MHKEFIKISHITKSQMNLYQKVWLNAVFSINKKDVAHILSLLKVTDSTTHFWVKTIVKLLFYQKNSETKHLFNMFI